MDDVMQEDTLVQQETDLLSEADENMEEDNRSSSLSDIDDAAETLPNHVIPGNIVSGVEADSEAETERLENSPAKFSRQLGGHVNAKLWENSPSKLSQTAIADEQFSDSAMSSPLASAKDSFSDEADNAPVIDYAGISKKRKLSTFVEDADNEAGRSPIKRVGSIRSDADDAGPDKDEMANEQSLSDELEDMQNEDQEAADVETGMALAPSHQISGKSAKSKNSDSSTSTRRTLRNKTIEDDVQETDLNEEDQIEEAVESEDEVIEDEDVDDIDAVAKNEEENARRLAAMEALSALERQFATLRDRLYDERIAAINNELSQLADSKPSHPELLRQVKIVEKYRDDKFDYEQKLLVFKIGALKRKSVAERAQIHSAYYQTIRDVREKHLEKISEHFYRIQRDRFRTEAPAPSYVIAFPKQRQQQVIQQTAYNKEVSILSGVAKYVGFPAAPELPGIRRADLEEDLEKMGISTTQSKPVRVVPRPQLQSAFSSTISRPAAEEQFLEQTPWANPQHPSHQHLQRLSRQTSEPSRAPEDTKTPSHQQQLPEANVIHGSASTIQEEPSAQASSAIDIPLGDQNATNSFKTINGDVKTRTSLGSSPTEIRRALPGHYNNQSRVANQSTHSSPTLSRQIPRTHSPRIDGVHSDSLGQHDNSSPLAFQSHSNYVTNRLGVR